MQASIGEVGAARDQRPAKSSIFSRPYNIPIFSRKSHGIKKFTKADKPFLHDLIYLNEHVRVEWIENCAPLGKKDTPK